MASDPAPPAPALVHRRVLVIFGGLLLVMLLAALDSTIVARAGVDLMPVSAWLLLRLAEHPHADLESLARRRGVPPERVQEGLGQLRERGLLVERPAGDVPRHALTPAGCDVLEPREQREQLAAVLQNLARELVPESPRPAG